MTVIAAIALWLVPIIGYVVFIRQGRGTLSGGVRPPLRAVVRTFTGFVLNIPRSMIGSWYGSVGSALALALFGIMLLAGLLCLAGLRPAPERAQLLSFGFGIVVFTMALAFVRGFSGMRLWVYGLVLIVIQMRPQARAEKCGWHTG